MSHTKNKNEYNSELLRFSLLSENVTKSMTSMCLQFKLINDDDVGVEIYINDIILLEFFFLHYCSSLIKCSVTIWQSHFFHSTNKCLLYCWKKIILVRSVKYKISQLKSLKMITRSSMSCNETSKEINCNNSDNLERSANHQILVLMLYIFGIFGSFLALLHLFLHQRKNIKNVKQTFLLKRVSINLFHSHMCIFLTENKFLGAWWCRILSDFLECFVLKLLFDSFLVERILKFFKRAKFNFSALSSWCGDFLVWEVDVLRSLWQWKGF